MTFARRFTTSLAVAPFLLFLARCAAPPPPGASAAEETPTADSSGREAVAEGQEDSPFSDALQQHKHGTVYTEIDTYDVRNISFNTGHGFGSSAALVGYYLNTRYEIKKRFIDKLRVLGKITPSEARSVPHKYDMVEDKDLDYTFRTELVKTDGERMEFIVRINSIGGQLQEGGGFSLTGDELQSLRKIVFY